MAATENPLTTETETAHCRLVLPYTEISAGLSLNARGHPRFTKATPTRMVRADVTNLARAAHLHRLGRPFRFVDVELVWAPGERRRRDDDNLFGLVKVAADALAGGPRKDRVSIDLVADETSEFMRKACRIAPPPTPKGMWLELDPLRRGGRVSRQRLVCDAVTTRLGMIPDHEEFCRYAGHADFCGADAKDCTYDIGKLRAAHDRTACGECVIVPHEECRRCCAGAACATLENSASALGIHLRELL